MYLCADYDYMPKRVFCDITYIPRVEGGLYKFEIQNTCLGVLVDLLKRIQCMSKCPGACSGKTWNFHDAKAQRTTTFVYLSTDILSLF